SPHDSPRAIRPTVETDTPKLSATDARAPARARAARTATARPSPVSPDTTTTAGAAQPSQSAISATGSAPPPQFFTSPGRATGFGFLPSPPAACQSRKAVLSATIANR